MVEWIPLSAPKEWPQDHLNGKLFLRSIYIPCLMHTGHCIVQLCLIMQAIPHKGHQLPKGLDTFVIYARRFDIVPQVNPEVSQMTARGHQQHLFMFYAML